MTTNTKLCDNIVNQQSQKVIAELKLNHSTSFLDMPDKTGFTPLQLAAREGLVDVSLWLLVYGAQVNTISELLNSGIRCTALSLSASHGHLLISQILLAFGADKNAALNIAQLAADESCILRLRRLHLNEWIKNACLYFLIKNTDIVNFTPMCELVKRQISHQKSIDAQRIVEYSLYFKNIKIAKSYLNNIAETHSDPVIMSAAYWSIHNGDELFNDVCSNDNEWLLLLYQLYQNDKQKFANVFNKATNQVQSKFLQNSLVMEDDRLLTTPQKHLYFAAAIKASREHLQNLCQNDEDYYAVMAYSFFKSNFVAILSLENLKDLTSFIRNCITQNNRPLLQFIIIATPLNLLKTVLDIRDITPQSFEKLISSVWTKTGLLNALISYSVQANRKPDQSTQEIIFTYPLDERSKILLINIHKHYNIDLQTRFNGNQCFIFNNFTYTNLSLIRQLMGRFGIDVISTIPGAAEKDVLVGLASKDVWELVISYFTLKDLRNFNQLSHFTKELTLKNHSIADEIQKYSQEIQALQSFIEMINDQDYKNRIFEFFDNGSLFFFSILTFALIICGVMIHYAYPGNTQRPFFIPDPDSFSYLFWISFSLTVTRLEWICFFNIPLYNSDLALIRFGEFSDKLNIAARIGFGNKNEPKRFIWADPTISVEEVLSAAVNTINEKKTEYSLLKRREFKHSKFFKTGNVLSKLIAPQIKLEESSDLNKESKEDGLLSIRIDRIDQKQNTDYSYSANNHSLWHKDDDELQPLIDVTITSNGKNAKKKL